MGGKNNPIPHSNNHRYPRLCDDNSQVTDLIIIGGMISLIFGSELLVIVVIMARIMTGYFTLTVLAKVVMVLVISLLVLDLTTITVSDYHNCSSAPSSHLQVGHYYGSGASGGVFHFMEYSASPYKDDGSRTTIRIIMNLMTGLQVSLTLFFVAAALLRPLGMDVLLMLVYIFNCFVRSPLIVLVVVPPITLSPIVLV